MFRPIRGDSPKANAARTHRSGIGITFLLTPFFVVIYLVVPMLEAKHLRPNIDVHSEVLPTGIVFPLATLLAGLMLLYDGWWRLRRLS